MHLIRFFLTLGYTGTIRYAPGTFGTLVAIPPAMLIVHYSFQSTLFFLAVLIGVVSAKMIDKYEIFYGVHDPKEIVIDELVGVWITISLVGISPLSIALAFFTFRLFDIWKPSIIGRVDREMKGGAGVVLDDALAGVFAGILSALLLMGIEKVL